MKRRNRLLCALLAAALCLSLAGCAGGTGETAAAPASTPAPTPAPTPASRAAASADAPDKEETVYVQADASGRVREITVETVLNYPGKDGVLEDATNLADIKNTEGDEEFTAGKNGALTWEDHGETIHYEGTSGEDLPVTVAVTYWLDGEPIVPEDLAGRSGHVRIRFDYENHTAETVTVTHPASEDEDEEESAEPETEEVVTPIPFLAVTLAMLPESLTNITVTNGRLLSLGEQSVAMGYALPGLAEALRLTDYEPTEDIELPDTVEIEGDAEDFSLDFTATIVTNGLLAELEEDGLDDLEKLSDGMDKLAEASEALADGAGELADGASEYAGYMDDYVRGAWKLYSGAEAVRAGLAAVSGQTAPLRDGAAAVSAGLEDLRAALAGWEIPAMTDTAAALETVIAALDAFEGALDGLEGYEADVARAVSAADEVLAGVNADSLYAALDAADLTEEQYAALSAALAEHLDGVQSAVNDARYYLAQAPAALESPELAAYADTLGRTAALLRSEAEKALVSADELPASPAEAVAQLSALADGAAALCDAIDALADGSAGLSGGAYALAEAGDALAEAADALADGADALAEGMEEFDDEGIGELTGLADDELTDILTRLRALRLADRGYENFGGIAAGRTGSVRFIIETDGVEAD